ncbi:MAG TPA: Spy/CpxP family protein refolding chaperone [Gallionellaceae bacterium]|nr:Spy/CpxP family protein refolding chaperone [Gallionellaceae bacterium]
MNKSRIAPLFLALGLGCGLAAVSATTYAADASAMKSAPAPAGQPGQYGDGCDGRMGYHHPMMGGYGHGMMGGYGMMMESPRMRLVMHLNLSDEQRAKINKLGDELRHKNWARAGLMQDESAKLRDLYEADKRDPKAIVEEYRKIFNIKLQMIEAMVDTQNEVEALLTPDQLRELKEMRRNMAWMPGHPVIH